MIRGDDSSSSSPPEDNIAVEDVAVDTDSIEYRFTSFRHLPPTSQERSQDTSQDAKLSRASHEDKKSAFQMLQQSVEGDPKLLRLYVTKFCLAAEEHFMSLLNKARQLNFGEATWRFESGDEYDLMVEDRLEVDQSSFQEQFQNDVRFFFDDLPSFVNNMEYVEVGLEEMEEVLLAQLSDNYVPDLRIEGIQSYRVKRLQHKLLVNSCLSKVRTSLENSIMDACNEFREDRQPMATADSQGHLISSQDTLPAHANEHQEDSLWASDIQVTDARTITEEASQENVSTAPKFTPAQMKAAMRTALRNFERDEENQFNNLYVTPKSSPRAMQALLLFEGVDPHANSDIIDLSLGMTPVLHERALKGIELMKNIFDTDPNLTDLTYLDVERNIRELRLQRHRSITMASNNLCELGTMYNKLGE